MLLLSFLLFAGFVVVGIAGQIPICVAQHLPTLADQIADQIATFIGECSRFGLLYPHFYCLAQWIKSTFAPIFA